MKLLYLCTGNSARSIMAEAFTKSMLPGNAGVEVFSAGVRPAGIHPLTAQVMKETGIDLEGSRSKSIDEVPFNEMDVVVTLCDHARQTCPTPPAGARSIHWALQDPASESRPDHALETFRRIREQVRAYVRQLLFDLATNPALRRGS